MSAYLTPDQRRELNRIQKNQRRLNQLQEKLPIAKKDQLKSIRKEIDRLTLDATQHTSELMSLILKDNPRGESTSRVVLESLDAKAISFWSNRNYRQQIMESQLHRFSRIKGQRVPALIYPGQREFDHHSKELIKELRKVFQSESDPLARRLVRSQVFQALKTTLQKRLIFSLLLGSASWAVGMTAYKYGKQQDSPTAQAVGYIAFGGLTTTALTLMGKEKLATTVKKVKNYIQRSSVVKLPGRSDVSISGCSRKLTDRPGNHKQFWKRLKRIKESLPNT